MPLLALRCRRRPIAGGVVAAVTTTAALEDEAERALRAASEDATKEAEATLANGVALAAPLAAAAPAAPPPNPIAPPVVFAALAADSSRALAATTSSPGKTFIRAVLSGCYIAFGGLIAVAVVGASPAIAAAGAPGLARLIFALVFPVGLYLNLAHGGELFTGQTMRCALAVLSKQSTLSQLAQNWAVSFCGNLVGSLAIVALVLASGVFAPSSPPAAFIAATAQAKVALPFGEAVCRGVLANWLVCLAVWNASAARNATDRFFAIWPPIAGFVAAGLEYSVANMFIAPLGLAVGAGGLDLASFGHFLFANLLPVTLGNAIAGAVVVAGVSHAVYGAPAAA